jgi:hypothetical protein
MNDTFELLAAGRSLGQLVTMNRFHRQDLDDMERAGYPFVEAIGGVYVEGNVYGFTTLCRDPGFKVAATGKDDQINCRAYPRDSESFGGWDISLFGRTAEQMEQAGCPGWKNNRTGFARREYPGHKIVANVTAESEAEVNSKAMLGLAHRANVYTRVNHLVRVVYGTKPPQYSFVDAASPSIEIIPKPVLSEEIDAGCTFKKWSEKKGLVKIPVPERVLSAIHTYGNYSCIRSIVSVSRTPRFLPDGSLLTEPGYHTQSGIFYHPDKGFKLDEMMNLAEAKATLAAVIKDFPWQREAHRTAFYSFLLSLLGRPAYPGCTPHHLADANQPGSGKGLLWDVAAIIGLGYPLPRMTMTEAAEMKKAITACVLAGDAAFLLDNLTGVLNSAHLDALATSTSWKDRILGATEVREMPWHGVVCLTANNLRIPRDTFRRIVYARLQSPLENPESRDDMQEKRLLVHVKRIRSQLTTAALSILWQWHRAKRPHQNIPEWGSYAEWSDLIRQCMVWAELGDPITTRDSLRDADYETQQLGLLIEAWVEFQKAFNNPSGLTAGAVVDHYHAANETGPAFPLMREVIDELTGRDHKTELGKLLAKYKDRVVDGKCLVRSEGKVARWKVITINSEAA